MTIGVGAVGVDEVVVVREACDVAVYTYAQSAQVPVIRLQGNGLHYADMLPRRLELLQMPASRRVRK